MMPITFDEHFEFENLAQLKRWLDQFQKTDLETVRFDTNAGYLSFRHVTETLSDGSEVSNVRVAA